GLEAAAAPEDGNSVFARLLEKTEVERVALRVHLHSSVVEEAASVARGVHVDAAAQHEAVEGRPGKRREGRHDCDGLARDPGLGQRPQIVVGLREVRVAIERQGDAHGHRSNRTAMPIPPETQSVAMPRWASRRRISWSSVVAIRAPVAPIGWPSAMAPPLTLTLPGSS